MTALTPSIRVEQIGNATLYCGDCRDVLPQLGYADVVVTDPPYGIRHNSKGGPRGRTSWRGTEIANDQDTSLRDTVLDGFENVAAFGTWKTPPITDTLACLVWDKGPAFGMGDLAMPWKPSFELIYIKGRLWRGRRDPGVLRGDVQVSWENHPEGRTHPHQKPPGIIAQLIEKLPDNACVLDPFMGSGTTGVACAKLGRSFVGIEIEPCYFDVACRRIADAQRQLDMFVDPTPDLDAAYQRTLFDRGIISE